MDLGPFTIDAYVMLTLLPVSHLTPPEFLGVSRTGLIWAVDQTLSRLPRESGYARLSFPGEATNGVEVEMVLCCTHSLDLFFTVPWKKQTVRSGVIYAVGSFSAQMCPAKAVGLVLGCAPIGEVYVLGLLTTELITLGAHAQRGLRYLRVCVCFCVPG